jgi:hypothetical protein
MFGGKGFCLFWLPGEGSLIYWGTGAVWVSGLYGEVVENGWVGGGILGY